MIAGLLQPEDRGYGGDFLTLMEQLRALFVVWHMKRILLALICSAGLAAAADATGKWSGSFAVTADGETRDSTIFLKLKQEGTKITGQAGPNSEQVNEIKVGTIEGNKIKLE